MDLASSRVWGLKMEEVLSGGGNKEEYLELKGVQGCNTTRSFVFWEGLRRRKFGEDSK